MEVKATVQILGAKGFKGSVEGQDYDSTKLYVMMETSERNGTEVGFNASPMPWGKEENFQKVKGMSFPFKAEVVLNMTTKGMEVLDMRPVQAAPKAA